MSVKAILEKTTDIIPDRLFLKLDYYRDLHKRLDLSTLKIFNEKLQ